MAAGSSIQVLEDAIASLIQRCPDMRTLRQIHAHCLKFPTSSSLFAISKVLAFSALSPSGDIAYARRLFAQIPNPNLFSWNTLIRGCSILPHPSTEPISIYKQMLRAGTPRPNTFTLTFLLKACSLLSAFLEGLQLHSHAFKYGLHASPFVHTALLNLYTKCENIPSARAVFDEIPQRNLISWSAMIGGYARVGLVNQALQLFREMQEAGVVPDQVTMASVISACAKAGALDLGRWVHVFIDRKGIVLDLELSTALIDMYAKCGEIQKARELFDGMPVRDTMAWSSMIVGLAIHGHVKDALQLFSAMMDSKVAPNHVTFIGVLSACAHSGLVSDGRRYWSTMRHLGIEPLMEHYGCMVDLLCRAGHVEEAISFVKGMPIVPNSVIWRTLLAGCKNTGTPNEVVETAAEKLLEMGPLDAENYVLLSNLYATRCEWHKVSQMRRKMKELGAKVVPGCSSTEIDGLVHEFTVADDTHPEIQMIREALRDITERVRRAGHEPSTSSVLHDVVEEEKESALCEHSERLAIAYSLLKTKAPAAIKVVKNLRVCLDCHEVTKIISKVYDREIIVRDRVRFHHFVNGTCSCNDFW